MTETTVREIVRRAVSDAAFRSQLRSDPAKALAGISITAEERSALTSGDPARLTALGVDQRMSKAFAAGVLSEVSKAVVGSEFVNDPMFYSDETTGTDSAIAGDPASPGAASADATYGSTFDYLLRTTEGNIDASAIASPSYGSTTDHLLRTAEGNIDTSSALEPSYGSTSDHLLHTTEGTIDTGAVVDPSVDAPTDMQVTGEPHVTEF